MNRRGFFTLVGVAIGVPSLGMLFRNVDHPADIAGVSHSLGRWEHMPDHAAVRHTLTGEVVSYRDALKRGIPFPV